VRLSGLSWRAASHFVVEWGLWTLSELTPWRFSAPVWYTGRSTNPERNSGEAAVHLTWCDQAIRFGVLPGQTDLAHMLAGQPQLPASAGNQPGPPVSRLCGAGADGGPPERLFEEAEGMLHRERKYQRHSRLRSAGSGPPIQASHKGRGGSFLLGRRSTWTRTTLNGESGAPTTCSSVQMSMRTSP